MPLDQFLSVSEGLRPSGYRPLRVRPFPVGKEVQVAAIWTRDGRPWQMANGLSAVEIRQQNETWTKQGYVPADGAGFLMDRGQEPPTENLAALWDKPAMKEDAILLVGEFGTLNRDHPEVAWFPQFMGDQGTIHIPRASQIIQGGDRSLNATVWVKSKKSLKGVQCFWGNEEHSFEETVNSLSLLVDVHVGLAPGVRATKERYTEQLQQAEARPEPLEAYWQRGQAHYHLGQYQEALSDLNYFIDKAPKDPKDERYNTLIYLVNQAYYHRALVHARLMNAEKARRDLIDHHWRTSYDLSGQQLPGFVSRTLGLLSSPRGIGPILASSALVPGMMYNNWMDYQRVHEWAIVSILLGQVREGLEPIERMVEQDRENSNQLTLAAQAYSLASGAVANAQPAKAKRYADRAVALLQQAQLAPYSPGCGHWQRDEALDPIRDHPVFMSMLRKANLERVYTSAWCPPTERTSKESHGLAPAEHLQACRKMAAQGFRPAAISLACSGKDKPLLTASVWHKRIVSDADKDGLANRQAQAAVALLRLGRPERVWPLLRHSPEPRLRTFLVHRLGPLGINPRILIDRLEMEPEESARQALILSLGEYTTDQLPAEVRGSLTARLLDWYRTENHPGIRGAIDWLLRPSHEGDQPRKIDWHQGQALRRIDKELEGKPPDQGRRWFVNSQGQTLVILPLRPGPVEFRMGSPPTEPDHQNNEHLQLRRLSRTFAIGVKNVTVEEYRRYKEPPGLYMWQFRDHKSIQDASVAVLPAPLQAWHEAAAYCNWLSKQEGIPEDQWCYLPNAKGEYAEGIRMRPNYLSLRGYRLPTEAEWEYACRAGTVASRYYGSSEEILGRYSWYDDKGTRLELRPVGQKKPNDFGLFDMHGLVREWCQNRISNVPNSIDANAPMEDKEDMKEYLNYESPILRGTGHRCPASNVRSACRGGGFSTDWANWGNRHACGEDLPLIRIALFHAPAPVWTCLC